MNISSETQLILIGAAAVLVVVILFAAGLFAAWLIFRRSAPDGSAERERLIAALAAETEKNHEDNRRFTAAIERTNTLAEVQQRLWLHQLGSDEERNKTYQDTLRAMDGIRADSNRELAEQRRIVLGGIDGMALKLDASAAVLEALKQAQTTLPDQVGAALKPEFQAIATTLEQVTHFVADLNKSKAEFLTLFNGIETDLKREVDFLNRAVERITAKPSIDPLAVPDMPVKAT